MQNNIKKILYKSNGQWTLLNKNIATKLEQPTAGIPEGTHDVEVHPMVDHLKRAKGLVEASGKPSVSVKDLEKAGVSSAIMKHVPRDAKGNVSSEAIDRHIDSLPKIKVRAHVYPYNKDAQKHHPDAKEDVISVHMHPDTLKNMSPEQKKQWNSIKNQQHDLRPGAQNDDDETSDKLPEQDQIGWSRVDAHSKPGHWHVDEIQSDFGTPKKIHNSILDTTDNDDKEYAEAAQKTNAKYANESQKMREDSSHPLYADTVAQINQKLTAKERKDASKRVNKYLDEHTAPERAEEGKHYDRVIANNKLHANHLHDLLSHGHEDPQHLIHSVVNELARKHGAKSMSMDTPEDQAEQSKLNDEDADEDEKDRAIPVHYKNTYDKRPKKLGYKYIPKDEVMSGTGNNNEKVQYSPVYKSKEHFIEELVKSIKQDIDKVLSRRN